MSSKYNRIHVSRSYLIFLMMQPTGALSKAINDFFTVSVETLDATFMLTKMILHNSIQFNFIRRLAEVVVEQKLQVKLFYIKSKCFQMLIGCLSSLQEAKHVTKIIDTFGNECDSCMILYKCPLGNL